MTRLLLMLLAVYRYTLSPLLGRNCRFFPSCSEYATDAIARHGSIEGSWLTFKRVCRCHPLHAGGYDPVP